MDCVQAQQMVRPYMDGVLSDRELEEFLNHVEKCPDCFGELEIYFSIYRTLNNVDEKGDYNYARKLRQKLQDSREYLKVRSRNKVFKVSVIIAAEFFVAVALYGLFWLPGGYISRHHTEIIQVAETEAGMYGLTDNETAGIDKDSNSTSIGNQDAGSSIDGNESAGSMPVQ